MFNFFFVRKHKNRVLLYIDRVFKGVNPDIQYALSIDEDEKFKEQKEVAKPKFSRELHLDDEPEEQKGVREPKFSRELDLDEKPEDKTGVSEPKYSRKPNLSDSHKVMYSDRATVKDAFDAKQIAQTMKSHLAETKPTATLMSSANISFVNKLEYYIREKKLDATDVYKKANIDRRLFSKMICNRDYQPSKDTVVALIFSLKLNLDEAKDLLERAGYTLSHSIRRDIIIEYFIKEGVYNLNNINAFLYNMDEKVIGRNL